jgi:hypothetical protein
MSTSVVERSEILHLQQLEILPRVEHRFQRFIAGVALDQRVKVELITEGPQSLLDMVHLAEESAEAHAYVRVNVATATHEAVLKTGEVLTTESDILPDGQFMQYGIRHASVYANTLRHRANHPLMRALAESETRHWLTLEELTKTDLLEDYYYVVRSRVPDNVSLDALDDEGFFIDTMSGVFQVSWTENGKLKTESAFVAGSDDGWTGERFDAEPMDLVGRAFGYHGPKDTLSQHKQAMLIRKDQLPDRSLTLVKMYDAALGGRRFFGQKGVVGDYDTFREFGRARQDSMSDLIDRATKRLIRNKYFLTDENSAIDMLARCVKDELLERARQDFTIDARVFGREAALHLEMYRLYTLEGDTIAAEQVLEQFEKTATIKTCTGGNANPDDWSGGEKKKWEKCQVCNTTLPEIGACSICEDCTKDKGKMDRAWQRFQQEQAKAKEQARKALKAKQLTPESVPA